MFNVVFWSTFDLIATISHGQSFFPELQCYDSQNTTDSEHKNFNFVFRNTIVASSVTSATVYSCNTLYSTETHMMGEINHQLSSFLCIVS